jgi:tol-pal system protein YbgF
MHKSVVTLISLVVAPVWAQVAPVEDLGSTSSRQVSRPVNTGAITAAPAPAPAAPNQALVDLHYEVQSMRDEMRQLRGMVEEQGNELRQLRQRQMDDYQDLDRRMGAMTAGAATSTGSGPIQANRSPAPSAPADSGTTFETSPSPSATTTPAFKPVQNPADEQAEYQTYTNNYNLLKARKIDEAVAGFKNQVAKYPSGKYTANAYYWLGEIHLLQNNLPEAEKAFAQVTNNFPAHRKAADAAFKLGKVYHQQGKNDQARAVLEKVAGGSSTAASLAQAYLSENF